MEMYVLLLPPVSTPLVVFASIISIGVVIVLFNSYVWMYEFLSVYLDVFFFPKTQVMGMRDLAEARGQVWAPAGYQNYADVYFNMLFVASGIHL